MCATCLSRKDVWSQVRNVAVADSFPGLSPGFRSFAGSQPLHFVVLLGLHTALNFASSSTLEPLLP